MRKFLFGLALVFGIPLLLLAIWAAWEHLRDPLAALDYGTPELRVVHDSVYTVQGEGGTRIYHDVLLFAGELDSIRFTVS